MNKEIWKDIKGYEGLYQASNMGRIKSLEKKVWNRFDYITHKERILIPRHGKKGYVEYALYKNSKRKDFKGHYLILSTFKENKDNKPQINHINGIKNDNRLENLEWCNNSENQIHAYKMGLKKPLLGEKNPCAKPVYQFNLDGRFIKKWGSLSDASRFYNKTIHIERHKSIGYLWKKEKEMKNYE